MNRRDFISCATAATLAQAAPSAVALSAMSAPLKPKDVCLLIAPFSAPEEHFRRVLELGFDNCFLSLDDYLGSFTPAVVSQFRDLIAADVETSLSCMLGRVGEYEGREVTWEDLLLQGETYKLGMDLNQFA